jgi:hypothetical protein
MFDILKTAAAHVGERFFFAWLVVMGAFRNKPQKAESFSGVNKR